MPEDKTPSTMKASIANAGKALRHVFIRDFMVECLIGVYEHEKRSPQRVRINLDLAVDEGEHPIICLLYTSPSPRDRG